MNIKDFKRMKLSESNLIKPAKFITYDKDLLENKLVDSLISMLEIYRIVVVLDSIKKKPMGILTWKDIVKILSNRSWDEIITRWDDIMTKWDDVIFVNSNDTVDSCLKKMSNTGFRVFPVLQNNELLGVLLSTDLRNSILNKVKITF